MYLIVGLGNPGKEYENTRHNFGWMVLDELQKQFFSKWQKGIFFKVLTATSKSIFNKIVLAKPQTFMNESGFSVAKLVNYYKIDLQNLIVVHDDLDLPLGTMRLSHGSGSAGHHGVDSIITSLGYKNEFTRLRLGIGPRPPEIPGDKFVLQRFSPEQQAIVKQVIKQVIEKIQSMLSLRA